MQNILNCQSFAKPPSPYLKTSPHLLFLSFLSLSGSNSSVKMTERVGSKDKDRERDREKGSAEGGPGKEAADKRKRNRATEKVLNSSSNPSSPGGAKRRRT